MPSSPKLSAIKSIGEEFANPDTIINYEIEIKNNGDATAKNVIVKDYLPEGFTFTETENLSVREWNIGDLLPGMKKTISYSVLVGKTVQEGVYKNRAEIKADNNDLVAVESSIEIRIPVVKGIETLPHTGINDFQANIILIGLLVCLIAGIFGLFALIKRKAIKLVFSLFLTLGSAAGLIYFYWPAIHYELFLPKAEITVEVKDNLAEKDTEKTFEANNDYLVIPKIGVEIPIVQGEDESTLEKGAWLLPKTSTPDLMGNTALAAHRFKYKPPSKETFYLLDKLTKDDLLTVFWRGKEYRYKIVWTKVVNPDDVEILEKTFQPSITLITCHPLFSDKQRLVVRGELI